MKLEQEFYKLPVCFDVERLRKELDVFAESEWQKHPSDYKGNLAIPLISVNGEVNDDFAGPMKVTRALKKAPYIQQVIASFNSVFGRSRLMRLEGQYEVPLHSDINYHWYSRVRIHIPIVTSPDVIFYCGDQQVHMAPGETWIFDAWKMHKVVNPSGKTRVHLVIDTAGSPEFWELVERAGEQPKRLQFRPGSKPQLQTEKFNVPLLMSPGEVDALIGDIVNEALLNTDNNPDSVEQFSRLTNRFRQQWRQLWSVYGYDANGWVHYQQLIDVTKKNLAIVRAPRLTNLTDASGVLIARVLNSVFHPELAETYFPVKDGAAATRHEHHKTGRNDPCPCGSGRKYKRCHGVG